jgi:hypothetical protein
MSLRRIRVAAPRAAAAASPNGDRAVPRFRPWRVVGASVRAPNRQDGSCQDAWASLRLPGGRWVAAVADGAGSALNGGVGAATAVAAATKSLRERLTGPESNRPLEAHVREAVRSAAVAVITQARSAGAQPRDYATTLLVAAGTPGRTAWGQVGDGHIVAETPEGELIAATMPDNGEAINETIFVTDPIAPQRLRISQCSVAFAGVALMTDGLRDVALRRGGREPYQGFFGPLFLFARTARSCHTASTELSAWLAGPDLSGRLHDDVTLVLATALGSVPR